MRLVAIGFLLAVSLSAVAHASEGETVGPRVVIESMASGEIALVGRDSGSPLSKAFLDDCWEDVTEVYGRLDCDDLIPVVHISRVAGARPRVLFAVTSEGASVENRWIFEQSEDGLRDVTAAVWPALSRSEISKRMIEATGDPKYTADFLLRVVHSPYRVRHLTSKGAAIAVHTGVPDETFGTKIGELRWDGAALSLR